MSKSDPKTNSEEAAAEICEVIELVAGEIDQLARAFELIQRACDEVQNPRIELDDAPIEEPVH